MKKANERLLVYVFGSVFLIALILLAIAFPAPTDFQYEVFKVILALAAAGVAVMIPGFINVEIKNLIKAGGAISVFAIIYFFTPARLITAEEQQLALSDIQLSSDLVISAARFDQEASDTIDIVLKNIGNQVAFLNNAQFQVHAIYVLNPNRTRYGAVLSTETYRIVLPFRETPYSLDKDLHQGIDPNEIDRFSIFLDPETPEGDKDYVFEFSIRFHFDGRTIDSPTFFYMPLQASSYMGPPQLLSGNLEIFKTLSVKKGIKSSKLQSLITRFIQEKPPIKTN